jgi:YbbR domain-containing protein
MVMGEEVNPSEVTISGNPEVLNAIESIATDILDIEGATSDVSKELELQQQEDVRLSPGQPSTIKVLVRIEKIIDKQVSFHDVELRNIPEGLEAKIDESEEDMAVVLRGPQSIVNTFNPEDLRVYMDINNSSRGERSYPILVDKLPEGLEVLKVEPEELKVTIK